MEETKMIFIQQDFDGNLLYKISDNISEQKYPINMEIYMIHRRYKVLSCNGGIYVYSENVYFASSDSKKPYYLRYHYDWNKYFDREKYDCVKICDSDLSNELILESVKKYLDGELKDYTDNYANQMMMFAEDILSDMCKVRDKLYKLSTKNVATIKAGEKAFKIDYLTALEHRASKIMEDVSHLKDVFGEDIL